MWIINSSGPKQAVIDEIKSRDYDTFKAQKADQLDRARALVKITQPPRGDYLQDVQVIEHELARMDDADRAMFDAARAACLALVAMVPQNHAGVCARELANPGDAPDGKTLSISVSGYDVKES
jgi:hypothetical protein